MSHDIGLLGRAILRREANRARQRAEKLRILHTIGTVIVSSEDVDKVLTRVVEAAVFISNAEEGSLLLLDEGTEELYLRAQKGLGEKYANGYRLPVEDSIAGEVVRTGLPQKLISRSRELKVVTGYMVNSIMYVPVCGPHGVIGALSVDNQVADVPFNDEDEEFLIILAGYAALALENARRIKDLERRSEEAAARNRGRWAAHLDDEGVDWVKVVLRHEHVLSPFHVPYSDHLLEVFNRYLSGMAEIQHCIDELEGKPPARLRVIEIAHNSPVVATVEGIHEAAAVLHQVISPQRRVFDEMACRLLIAEKEMAAERARIEALEARSRLAGTGNGDESWTANVAGQIAHLGELQQECASLGLDLQRLKIGLASHLVACIAPSLECAETVRHVVRILPALDQVLSSPLEASTLQEEMAMPLMQEELTPVLQ
ncbi:MAG TPA: GAF domain-containing protein [Anaerolineae bacterium]|nr:GAF domain-containing protein [Anaerolineae bacterium]